MKFTFIGTGSAFTLKNYNTSFIIERNNKRLLIDCGTDIRFALNEVGLKYNNIDAVYISHLHADHAGGLEYLAFCNYFDPNCNKKIDLFGNGKLLRDGWNNTWKGGLESIQGKVMSLSDYFTVWEVTPNAVFPWQGINFSIVQSVHIMNGYSIVPSYGLMFKDPNSGKKVYFTGDTQFNPNQMIDFYKKVDFIIQDCETSPFKSGVHANFSELATLPENIRNKMALVHFMDNIYHGNDISQEWIKKAKDIGFVGFINKGISFNLKDIFK